MSITNHKKSAETTPLNNVDILIFDDESRVIESIKLYSERKGFNRMFFLTDSNAVIKLIETEKKYFGIISSDFDIENEEFDGIAFIQYLYQLSVASFKAIIYTNKEQEISEEKKLWCNYNDVKIIQKSTTHERLFDTISLFEELFNRLPTNPKYSKMKESEILLLLAKDLLEELESSKDAYHSFGGNSMPMKNTDLINEIKLLSPLGKEYIGNWFEGVKRSLKFLEEEKFDSK